MEHTVLTPRDVDTFAQLRKVYYQIATVIGSSRFKEDIQKWNAILHQCGYRVQTMHCFGHLEDLDMTSKTKRVLDAMYMRYIDVTDTVLCVNPGGYIGMGAMDELLYAGSLNKPLMFTHPLDAACRGDLKQILDREWTVEGHYVSRWEYSEKMRLRSTDKKTYLCYGLVNVQTTVFA